MSPVRADVGLGWAQSGNAGEILSWLTTFVSRTQLRRLCKHPPPQLRLRAAWTRRHLRARVPRCVCEDPRPPLHGTLVSWPIPPLLPVTFLGRSVLFLLLVSEVTLHGYK